jgi:hypothetical protein
MPYKVEIFTKQIFPDGKFFNDSEVLYFSNGHELTANREAYDFIFSHGPKPKTEIELSLFFGEDGYENLLLCSLILHPLEDYSKNELNSRDFYYCFEIENLHLELQDYRQNSFDIGGSPLILKDEKIFIYNSGEGTDIEVTPQILSVYRDLIGRKSDFT